MSDPQVSPLKRALLAIDELQAKLDRAQRATREPIAVVGMGCRLPGGIDGPDALWRVLSEGVDAVSEVPADRWDAAGVYDPDPEAPGKAYTRWGGFLKNVGGFDPQLFGLAPREAVNMDPQQRLLLEVAWEALEHAGIAPDLVAGSSTGVFVGICSSDYERASPHRADASRINAYSASGTAHSIASGRLAYVLGLHGPAISVDTACSSSLVAVHLACQSLRLGECRMALTGGVHLMLGPENTILFCKSKMMSPEGRCKTFSASADGFVLGEGAGILVLKRLADARADGDRVIAVIRGTACNQDGASGGLTVPSGPAQESVIRACLASAGVVPSDVTYVEAHGTGTSLGDPIEVRALAAALGENRSADAPLLIGSAKTNFGHLEAAAGVTGLLKAILAVSQGEIPKHLHAETLSPHIPWSEVSVRVARERTRWPAGRPRIAGVSAFGFSGTNAHAIVEAPPAAGPSSTALERPRHVLALSARTPAAVIEVASAYRDFLDVRPEAAAVDVAHTANVGRAHLGERRAITFADREELRARLDDVARGKDAPSIATGSLEGTDRPRIAFLFTGQGSQYAGMGKALYDAQPAFRDALDRCALVLDKRLGRPLLPLLFDSGQPLDETAFTQPGLFALEYALATMWRSFGVEPLAVLGHSVGEYVAACVAGVFSLEDGLSLIAERGRLMQALPAGGVMAAVIGDEDAVRAALAGNPQAEIAAVNAPKSVVISGTASAVAAVRERLRSQGIASKPLTVSHAFHSSLMDPILAEFERAAAAVAFTPPRLSLVSNVTGEAFRGGKAPDAAYWASHLRSAVRFRDGLEGLRKKGYRVFLEIGPNPTLCSFGEQASAEPGCAWLPSLRRGRDEWETVLHTLAALYARGTRIDWAGFDKGFRRQRVALPTYPFERRRYWFDHAKAAARSRGAGGHPLLGARVRTASSRDTIFERPMTADDPAFLGDHRVHGLVVCPATAYIEMALRAGRVLCGFDAIPKDLTIREPLCFQEGEERVVQTVVAPKDDGALAVSIFSAPPESDDWRLHATAELGASGALPGSAELAAARERCKERVDAEAFYSGLVARGLDLRGRFRGIKEIFRGKGEAVARVEPPASLVGLADYEAHPALLDACVQVLAGAMGDDARGAEAPIYMPLSFQEVALARPFAPPLWSHARVRAGRSDETLHGDIDIFDLTGRPVGAIRGFALKKAPAAALLGASAQPGIDELCYHVEWVRQSAVGPQRAPSLPLPSDVLEGSDARLAALSQEHGHAPYAEIEPVLDDIVAAYVVGAFERLGWKWESGSRQAARGIASRLGVASRHERPLLRLLAFLVEQGLLKRAGPDWVVASRPKTTAPEAACDALLAAHPGFRGELSFTRRFGPALADVLAGTADPLQLLFPGGSSADADELYLRSAGARTYNALVKESIERMVGATPGALRFLEIGGGTGGTTAVVLPTLSADRAEYTFTDVSPLFVARAQERFGSLGFFRSQVLDVEIDPAVQGLSGQRFDVILAANVLHATRDLRETFSHVRKLLAPGGLLILIEVTRPQAWLDMTFGFTEGWWRFTDADLRSDYPLLAREAWLRFLRDDAGFAEATCVPAESKGDREPIQAVVVAREPLAAAQPAPNASWLVFADAGGVGDGVAARLGGLGPVTVVRAGEVFAEEGGRFTINPQKCYDYVRVLKAKGMPKGVLHLFSLDGRPVQYTTPETLAADVRRGTGSALALAQALVAEARSGEPPPRLWIVTRGAQPAGASLPSPSQAAVWGFSKALRLEHPELRSVTIDLAPHGQAGEGEALINELVSGGDEEEVALRATGRFVPRLARGAAEATSAAPQGSWELSIGRRGVLGNLVVKPTTRPLPGPGQVEIDVRSVGLNFRDVLSAMGLYPGEPPPFGSECSGRVVRVGPGVTSLREGQDVVAVATGSFRSPLVADARLVVPKPDGLSYEEAAGIAVPFVTAWFCLQDVARLRAGDKVLIHAAAGGVGLAAVQVALAAGAEIFATAGSPEKRAFLRRAGVPHVMDSRSLEFSSQILEATGGRGVDVVLNSLAGDFADKSFAATAPGGRFVEIGKREIWSDERAKAERPDVAYTIVDWGETARREPARIRGVLDRVVSGFADGTFAPLPITAYGLDETVTAFRTMAQGRHLGKIAISLPRAAHPPEIRSDASYMVTGGFGGLGLRTAQWLAARGAKSLVLVGRREPSADAQRLLEALSSGGARVRSFVADVADAAAMSEVFASVVKEVPPLRGIVHSAGALDDALVTQLDWSRFDTVLGPKVAGAWNLHALSLGLDLDFFVAYSSIAALLGSPGQSNHAAANAFLDAFAHHRASAGKPGLSVNWGVWDEIGAAARLGSSERAAGKGIKTFSPEKGIAALEKLLGQPTPQVGVVAIDWSLFANRYPNGIVPKFFGDVSAKGAPARAAATQSIDLRGKLAQAAEASREGIVRVAVREAALKVLGLDPDSGLDVKRPLQEMGLDSLMAVELRNALGAIVGQTLPATLLFDYPTAEGLVAYLSGDVLGLHKAPEPAAANEARPNVVANIEDLSDEEVERMLAAKMAKGAR